MKEGDMVFVNDLRYKKDDERGKVLYGRIRHISENDGYENVWLDTGFQITIKKGEIIT